MKKILIIVITIFMVFVVFSVSKINVTEGAEPNFIKVEIDTIRINNSDEPEFIRVEIGNLTYTTEIDYFELTPSMVGRTYEHTVDINYSFSTTDSHYVVDIYKTVLIGTLTYHGDNDEYVIINPYVYIPYSVEYFATTLSRGYAEILRALKDEFNQGFPNVPEDGAGVIDYVKYIGIGLYHSIGSVAITFKFFTFPINVMRGSFI